MKRNFFEIFKIYPIIKFTNSFELPFSRIHFNDFLRRVLQGVSKAMSAMSLSLPGLRHSTSCVMKYSHLQLRLKILSPSFNVFGKLQQLPGFRKYFVLTGNLYKPLVFVIVRCYFLNVVSFLVCIYQGVAGKRTTPPFVYAPECYFYPFLTPSILNPTTILDSVILIQVPVF